VRRDNGNIDPLPHAAVIDVADVWPTRIILNLRGMLLDVHSGVHDSSKYSSQCVAKPVVPTHNMAT